VLVSLRGKLVEGIVIDLLEKLPEGIPDVKQINRVIQKEFLSVENIAAAKWTTEKYFCSLRQALGLFLPPAPWASVLPRTRYFLRLKQFNVGIKGKKQKAVMEFLQSNGSILEEKVMMELDVSKTIIKSLIEKEIVERTAEFSTKTLPPKIIVNKEPRLNDEQTSAIHQINHKKPTLLFGVTGSGKTEIYITLALRALTEGKSAIILAPEIFLAEHLLHRLEESLPKDSLVMLHSKLTMAQEKQTWRTLSNGSPHVVVGTRSALFAPVKNLGLIVLDEEHEWTYKNEQTPRYHARNVAEELARQTNAKLVLGTATPSLESYAKAKDGTYTLARLKARYLDAAFPNVEIIDLADASFGNLYPLTTPLLNALKDRFEKNEQSILLLNRRGSATALLCLDCRRRLVSPVTQLPFTVHHGPNGAPFLFDHASDLRLPVPEQCPHCKSVRLKEIGAGTQRIEALLQKALPSARIRRADADVLDKPGDMKNLLEDMRNGAVDILLGTQLVAKGLDLPKVTLAAVLVADVGISLPHFRAGERVFQLLSQLTGRSGRHAPGDVIIQTFRPDAPEVVFAAKHDAEGYLEAECKLRSAYQYPPFVPMVRLLSYEEGAERKMKTLLTKFQKKIETEKLHVSVSTGPTFFSGGKVWQLLIRGNDALLLANAARTEGVSIDIDPMETL
jgi:primosomal protein N' (replication factor Y)